MVKCPKLYRANNIQLSRGVDERDLRCHDVDLNHESDMKKQ